MTAITSEQARERLASLVAVHNFCEIITREHGTFILLYADGYRELCEEFEGKPPRSREAITVRQAVANWLLLLDELTEDVTSVEIVPGNSDELDEGYANSVLLPLAMHQHLTGEADRPAVTEAYAAANFGALITEVAENGGVTRIAADTLPVMPGDDDDYLPELNAILMAAVAYQGFVARIKAHGNSYPPLNARPVTEAGACENAAAYLQAITSCQYWDEEGHFADYSPVSFEIATANGSVILLTQREYENLLDDEDLLRDVNALELRAELENEEEPDEDYLRSREAYWAPFDAAEAARKAAWS